MTERLKNAVFSHAHTNVALWPPKADHGQVKSCRGSVCGLYTTLNDFGEAVIFDHATV